MDLRIVLSTVADEASAERIAQTLVGEKLAACVNVLPLAFSVYRWKEKIEKEREFLLIIKMPGDRLGDLMVRLKAVHPYETPEIACFRADPVNSAYFEWVMAATRN